MLAGRGLSRPLLPLAAAVLARMAREAVCAANIQAANLTEGEIVALSLNSDCRPTDRGKAATSTAHSIISTADRYELAGDTADYQNAVNAVTKIHSLFMTPGMRGISSGFVKFHGFPYRPTDGGSFASRDVRTAMYATSDVAIPIAQPGAVRDTAIGDFRASSDDFLGSPSRSATRPPVVLHVT